MADPMAALGVNAPNLLGGGGGGDGNKAPIFIIDNAEKQALAEAAIAEAGIPPAEAKFLLEQAKTNAAPLMARIGRAKAAKPTPEEADAAYRRKKDIDKEYAKPEAQKFQINPADLSPEEAESIKGIDPAIGSSSILSRRQKLADDKAKQARAIQLVDQLKIQYPQYADRLEALKATPEAIPNIISSLYSKSFTEPKEEKFKIDRAHLPPGLAKYAPFMSDEQISQLAAADYKNRPTQGGNPPGFKGLTIVQDDRFKRSGLKTGDTVCIKIP